MIISDQCNVNGLYFVQLTAILCRRFFYNAMLCEWCSQSFFPVFSDINWIQAPPFTFSFVRALHQRWLAISPVIVVPFSQYLTPSIMRLHISIIAVFTSIRIRPLAYSHQLLIPSKTSVLVTFNVESIPKVIFSLITIEAISIKREHVKVMP